ncbi:hypothetical protein EOD39_7183 [Acipenser ruthenus]|uniref:Regulator of G-protein signaling 1 n=1 Tax=Acipenser ruthenus TaxID=7906 RepID=A0A444U7V9_ACIRT|nr:hypothetical protein EOD39_7183 [Acipenser ruthenus]
MVKEALVNQAESFADRLSVPVFDGLNKAGRIALVAFLKSEFSEENILFWLACEEYKQTKSTSKMIEKSKEIFLEYVKVGAPKEGVGYHNNVDVNEA